jgi:pimeloyl-ACP methyl ester carboxylesterase
VSRLVIVDSRPALPEDRVARMRARGQRPPRLHASPDEAVRAFRLLPPETSADPALLEHLGRAGLVQANGGWRYRFDPACYAARRPVDAWPLLPRVAARTLVVRGEHSPIMTRDIAERMQTLLPDASVVEIPGAYHHLVLDAPEAFTRALAAFLG